MRLVQFLQVIVLLLLLGYALLVALENPLPLRLPLPGGQGAVLPAGLALGLALLAGMLYAAFLILPRTLRLAALRRRDLQRRVQAERRLQATLHSLVRSGALSGSGESA